MWKIWWLIWTQMHCIVSWSHMKVSSSCIYKERERERGGEGAGGGGGGGVGWGREEVGRIRKGGDIYIYIYIYVYHIEGFRPDRCISAIYHHSDWKPSNYACVCTCVSVSVCMFEHAHAYMHARVCPSVTTIILVVCFLMCVYIPGVLKTRIS